MKYSLCVALMVTCLSCLLTTSLGAQDSSSSNKPAEKKPDQSAELAAIRAGSQAFVSAFDKGDAKAVAALWTEDGEYVDESGKVFSGRSEIAKEYATFFAAHQGHKIKLAIDSLKLLSDSAAIEDGRVMLDPAPAGPPSLSKYTVVHVKVDGKWLMSTVRDTRIETPSAYRNVADLEWMIGSWSAEEHGQKTEVTCRWVANKSFIERTYKVTGSAGHVTSSGLQIIGWNSADGRLQSWNFAADGGHGTGSWTPREGGWAIVSQGTMSDGTATSAVTLLTRLDDEAFSWQAVSRSAAGMALPDTDEIVLKRKPK